MGIPTVANGKMGNAMVMEFRPEVMVTNTMDDE